MRLHPKAAQDTVSKLYDFPAREYGIQGRWPSPDPSGLSSASPTRRPGTVTHMRGMPRSVRSIPRDCCERYANPILQRFAAHCNVAT